MSERLNAEEVRARFANVEGSMSEELMAERRAEAARDADPVRHVQVETPHWDTKIRCACREVFVSRCEMWKHQADAYLRLIDGSGCAQ